MSHKHSFSLGGHSVTSDIVGENSARYPSYLRNRKPTKLYYEGVRSRMCCKNLRNLVEKLVGNNWSKKLVV